MEVTYTTTPDGIRIIWPMEFSPQRIERAAKALKRSGRQVRCWFASCDGQQVALVALGSFGHKEITPHGRDVATLALMNYPTERMARGAGLTGNH